MSGQLAIPVRDKIKWFHQTITHNEQKPIYTSNPAVTETLLKELLFVCITDLYFDFLMAE